MRRMPGRVRWNERAAGIVGTLLLVGPLAGCSGDAGTTALPGSGATAGANGASGGAAAGNAGAGGAAAGAFGGDGGTGGTGSTGDPNVCAEVEVGTRLEVTPGNLMVIFDRSQSMAEDFDTPSGPAPKWVAAGDALMEALSSFSCSATAAADCVDQLTVGAVLFPTKGNLAGNFIPGGIMIPGISEGEGEACEVDPIDSSEQISFRSAGQFVDAWGPYWDSHPLVLTTPINLAFQRSVEAVADGYANGGLTGKTAAVLFTDGAPFCNPGTDAAQQALAWWQQQGIPTHVVGLPGATGVQALRDIASAGGTNDYITPADSAELTSALRSIVTSAVQVTSCTVSVEGTITDVEAACSRGDVRVAGEAVPCDGTDGFTVDDGQHLTLHGPACMRLEASGTLKATFPCDVVELI